MDGAEEGEHSSPASQSCAGKTPVAGRADLLSLADEVIFHIFSFLSAKDLWRLLKVCVQLRRCAEDESLWKARCVHEFAQERGLVWLEKFKPQDQRWIEFYHQLASIHCLVIFSGEQARDQFVLGAIESDLKRVGLRKLTMMDGIATIPTREMLRPYTAVMVTSDNSFMKDNTILGNVMADYVDQGNGVVLGGFVECGCPMTGRWTDVYNPITPRQSCRTTGPKMNILLEDHPVMAGVQSLHGNPDGETPFSPGTATPSSTTIAEWMLNDEEADRMLRKKRIPLVVEKHGLNGKVIGLNFTPTSSIMDKSKTWAHVGYDHETDGALIMANALLYCSIKYPKQSDAVASIAEEKNKSK